MSRGMISSDVVAAITTAALLRADTPTATGRDGVHAAVGEKLGVDRDHAVEARSSEDAIMSPKVGSFLNLGSFLN